MITTIRTIAVVTGLVVASASFANSEFQEPLTLAQKAVQSPLFIDIISSYSAKDFDCSPCQANGALPPKWFSYLSPLQRKWTIYAREYKKENLMVALVKNIRLDNTKEWVYRVKHQKTE